MDPAPQNPTDQTQDINQQLYERNVELAIRNRTLSALSKIYEIINSSQGLKETSAKLVEAVVADLQFRSGFIALVNKEEEKLKIIATSSIQSREKVEALLGTSLDNLGIPMSAVANYCVISCTQNRKMMTNFYSDITTPAIPDSAASQIEELLGIKTTFVFPLVSSVNTSGVLVLSMDKHVGDLTRSEKDTLKELIELVTIAIDRAQLLDDLKVANLKLQELDKKKDEFVSLASHELRTPMTAIRSYLWLALAGKGGPLNEKQTYYLDRSYNSTVRLIKLVNDMLNVSRIESGRITLEVQKIDLGKFTDEVIGEVKPRADELGITLENTYDQTHPMPEVLADPDKIKEVLINFIGNSLKFSTKGQKVSVSFETNAGMVIIHVTDHGEGISPEDMDKLFQKFSLIKESYVTNQKAAQGTGLGLYISKSIVELHGGKIWAESPGHGQGATFSFSLKIYNDDDFNRIRKDNEGKEGLGIIPNVF